MEQRLASNMRELNIDKYLSGEAKRLYNNLIEVSHILLTDEKEKTRTVIKSESIRLTYEDNQALTVDPRVVLASIFTFLVNNEYIAFGVNNCGIIKNYTHTPFHLYDIVGLYLQIYPSQKWSGKIKEWKTEINSNFKFPVIIEEHLIAEKFQVSELIEDLKKLPNSNLVN